MLTPQSRIFKGIIVVATSIVVGLVSCHQVTHQPETAKFYFHKSFGLFEIKDTALLHYTLPCIYADIWKYRASSGDFKSYYSTGVSRFFCAGDPVPDTAYLSLQLVNDKRIKLSSPCQIFFNGQNHVYLSPLGYDGGIGEVKDLTVYHGGYNSDPSKTFSKSQLDSLISKSKISLDLESALWMFFIGDTGYKRFYGMTDRESVWMKLRFANGDEKIQEVATYGIHCWAGDFLDLLLE